MSTVSPRRSGSDLSSIDVLCDRFEDEWLAGHEPKIEEFLALAETAGADHSTLLSELLAVELEYRRKRGETPSVHEYLTRFPDLQDAIVQSDLFPDADAMGIPDAQETVTFAVERAMQFQHYRLLGRVGAGHFGVVWRAKDTRLDRDVAIKVPRKGELDRDETQRFLREARAVAQLSHRHIVAVHDVGDEQNPYIVSDYIDGATLKDVLKQRELTARKAAELCAQIADALEHAHQNGVVHRDLKPGNVLMDDQGEPYVVDFGLARRISGDSTVTVDGEIVGTPAYMSPEQASGRSGAVDARTDVYSLGMVLYRLLTGTLPFQGEVFAILNQVLHVEPKPPSKLNAEVPRDLETICLKAIAKEPSRRYASAAEFASDLRRFLDGRTILARRAGLLERTQRWCRRNVAVAVSVVVALTAGSGLMAVLVIPRQPEGLRTVTLTTEPPGAKVAFIPLHELTGEPQPEGITHAPGSSPVNIELLPADYLVVAYFDDERFHEVYRHVPREDEGLPGWAPHLRWKVNKSVVFLPKIRIPDGFIAEGMAYIEGRLDFQRNPADSTATPDSAYSIPSFYMDCHEFTVQQFKSISRGLPGYSDWVPVPEDHALTLSWHEAVRYAERIGKRLPSQAEYEFAATAGGTRNFPWGDAIPEEARVVRELGPVGTPEFDRLDTAPPVFGLCSNVAEWSSTSASNDVQRCERSSSRGIATSRGDRIACGGDVSVVEGSGVVSAETRNPRAAAAVGQYKLKQGLGFRCVRSVKPRLDSADFVRVPSTSHR